MDKNTNEVEKKLISEEQLKQDLNLISMMHLSKQQDFVNKNENNRNKAKQQKQKQGNQKQQNDGANQQKQQNKNTVKKQNKKNQQKDTLEESIQKNGSFGFAQLNPSFQQKNKQNKKKNMNKQEQKPSNNYKQKQKEKFNESQKQEIQNQKKSKQFYTKMISKVQNEWNDKNKNNNNNKHMNAQKYQQNIKSQQQFKEKNQPISYFNDQQTETLLNRNRLFKGKLLIKRDNKFCGFVILDKPIKYKQSNEILTKIDILGASNLNGALINCIVGVQIKDKDFQLLDFSSLMNNNSNNNKQNIQQKQQKSQQSSEEKSNSSEYETVSESEVSEINSESESEDEFPEFVQPAPKQNLKQKKIQGKIVKIFENPYLTKLIIGKIKHNDFIPMDEQLPVMRCTNPDNFFQNIEKSEQRFYLGKTFINNEAFIFPRIQLIKEFTVTENKQLELETNAILYDLEIPNEQYNDLDVEYLKDFPPIETEITKNRKDLSNEIAFTIDPITARDLDDSLSIKRLEGDNYEVSVHISDVSYYLANQTELDKKAQLKTTSFYLPHKVLPMLPEQLSSHLCSLNPGEYKLTITCAFVINLNGEVTENFKIFKSAIKSRAKMSYQMAQEIIEGKDSWKIWQDSNRLKVSGEPEFNQMVQDLKTLNTIAQNRKMKRIENGSIVINNNQFYFQLDENSMPVSYTIDQRKEANFLVEEFMLLANQFVGKFLIENRQEQALLRNHPKPLQNSLQYLQELAQNLNLPNTKITKSNINKFIKECMDNPQISQKFKDILLFKLMRNMKPALYFIVGQSQKDEWHHFALNFDVYTHFTSPIRRYPDVIVHRLLTNILDKKPKLSENEIIEYNNLMQACNKWKLTSRKLQERCSRLFMCLHLKQQSLFTQALILQINGKNQFTVVVPLLNIERQINFKNCSECIFSKIQINANSLKELDTVFAIDEKTKIKLRFKTFMEIYVKITSNNEFPVDYDLSLAIPKDRNQNLSQDQSDYYILK